MSQRPPPPDYAPEYDDFTDEDPILQGAYEEDEGLVLLLAAALLIGFGAALAVGILWLAGVLS